MSSCNGWMLLRSDESGGKWVGKIHVPVESVVDDRAGGFSGLRNTTSYASTKSRLIGSASVEGIERTMLPRTVDGLVAAGRGAFCANRWFVAGKWHTCPATRCRPAT